MTDDSKLVNAYKSMYEHHQKDTDGKVIEHDDKEQTDEAVVTGSLLAAKAAMGAIKGAKVMGGLSKAANIAGKVGAVADGVGKVKDTADKLRGKGQLNNSESVELHDMDGNLTHEITDVVTPKPLGNPDENLANRLWDQVAANLTTLGEMSGTRYQVTPLEEGKKKKKKLDPVGKEDADVDNDGDVDKSDSYLKNRRDAIGKAMKKEEVENVDEVACWDTHKKVGMKKKGNKMVNDCRPKNESFNVKSPVSFSKQEEEVEETMSEETVEKHASSILKAHKSIQK
jgi:hypothetical protein|tara:strand:+ start:1916 stop:2767 length:852 start_codon:yes stop_codon:yes gene_type:complete